MWEVMWTDPDKESRKEHRERKAIEREQREQREQKEKSRVARSSGSTRRSSISSVADKSLGFFGSKSLKRTITTSISKASAATLLATPTPEGKTRRRSYFGTNTFLQPSDTSTHSSQRVEGSSLPDQFLDSCQDSAASSPRGFIESVFSRWTDSSMLAASPSTTSITGRSTKSAAVVQTLGPSSFIKQTTEISVAPKAAGSNITGMSTEVTISADPAKEEPPTPPSSPKDPFYSPQRLDMPVNLVPGPKSPLRRSTSPFWAANFKPNNPDAWKPPDAWDCGPGPEDHPAVFEDIVEEPTDHEDVSRLSLDLNGMQREVRRMAAASPSIVLLRLKEEWGCSEDANLYKELEMEKRRWLLSALHNMEQPVDADPAKFAPLKITPANAKKVLALYETQATTSYLAAVHHNKQVYHLSPAPLSHTLFPNIHPVLVPAISSFAFPLAPQLFGAVYSLGLPAMLASPEIPGVLRNVHRCLAVGGTFHITLIDPMPCASGLGPVMRAWLEENLMLNLERNFRCTNPSKLFPIWLADTSLRAEGSTITTVKFFAETSKENDLGVIMSESPQLVDKVVKQDLRCHVGRMLWREVWGAYVTANNWWWEDPECVDECLRYGTFWEFNLIEAVKDA